jgi:hypothetical protein
VPTEADPLAARLDAIREDLRITGMLERDGGYQEPTKALAAATSLLAALETALEALARHQGVYADAEGTVCAGCLEPVECPDTARVTAALLGEGG